MNRIPTAFTVIDRSIVLFAIFTVLMIRAEVKELQETIDTIKPIDDCAWLFIDGKRGAVIYNRFDATITIQCKGGEE